MFGKGGGGGVGWGGGCFFPVETAENELLQRASLGEARRGCGALAAARLQMLPRGFSIKSHLSSKFLREHMRRMNPR